MKQGALGIIDYNCESIFIDSEHIDSTKDFKRPHFCNGKVFLKQFHFDKQR